jgi:membrane peptidoglycan carboxypeptidase
VQLSLLRRLRGSSTPIRRCSIIHQVAVGKLQPTLGQRVLRILRRLVLVLSGALVLAAAVCTLYLVTLRSVSDAPSRVRAILAQHHEPTAPLPAPGRLVAAVVSTEDEHFYANVVVNVLTGAGRAALAALRTEGDPGGSTIQQQLAKTLYGRETSVTGTLREIGLGVKLALAYSRRQILRMYLNSVYYGNGYWGVVAAAHGYFRTTPADLTWGEAAMLAGLLQAPSAYDPETNHALARARQHHVLSQLVVNHYLTRAQANAAFAAGLPLGRGG